MFHAYSSSARDLAEVVFGFGIIIVIIWSPDNLQHILAPIGFITTLAIAVAGRRAGTFKNDNDDASVTDFGLSCFAVVHSLWILPAAIVLAAISMLISAKFGAYMRYTKVISSTSQDMGCGLLISNFCCRIISCHGSRG